MTGVEPATLCLASIRSSQLSYTRMRARTLANSRGGVKTKAPAMGRRVGIEYRHGQRVYSFMNRVKKHLFPKRRIAERLRRAGYRVQSISATHGYDLLLNDRVRVALRVAFPRMRKHHVTVRGRQYTYRLPLVALQFPPPRQARQALRRRVRLHGDGTAPSDARRGLQSSRGMPCPGRPSRCMRHGNGTRGNTRSTSIAGA